MRLEVAAMDIGRGPAGVPYSNTPREAASATTARTSSARNVGRRLVMGIHIGTQ